MGIRHGRRALAAAAVIGGALLMWLSPDTVVGAAVMLAGLALEALGIGLDHRA